MSAYVNPPILLMEEFCEMVKKGTKTSTVRTEHRDMNLGLTQIDVSNGEGDSLVVNITAVRHLTRAEVMADDAIALKDGFNSAAELETEIKKIYVDDLGRYTEEQISDDAFPYSVFDFELVTTLPDVRPQA